MQDIDRHERRQETVALLEILARWATARSKRVSAARRGRDRAAPGAATGWVMTRRRGHADAAAAAPVAGLSPTCQARASPPPTTMPPPLCSTALP